MRTRTNNRKSRGASLERRDGSTSTNKKGGSDGAMNAKIITATMLTAAFLISVTATISVVSAPPQPPKADLSVIKIGPESAYLGDRITYTYTIHNYGPDRARSPVEVFDDKLGTFVYTDKNGKPKDLDRGDTWTLTVSYTILDDDTSPLVNMAIVFSNTDDPNIDNNVIIWSIHILPPAPRCIYWHMCLTTNYLIW